MLILFLGFFSFIYNLFRLGLPEISESAIQAFLQGQLGSGEESLIGTIFDCLLRFACNVDIYDLKTYFRIFGV